MKASLHSDSQQQQPREVVVLSSLPLTRATVELDQDKLKIRLDKIWLERPGLLTRWAKLNPDKELVEELSATTYEKITLAHYGL